MTAMSSNIGKIKDKKLFILYLYFQITYNYSITEWKQVSVKRRADKQGINLNIRHKMDSYIIS